MRRIIYFLAITAICAVSLMAHPLGNFSVNQFARLEVEKNQINLRAVLDMAEIPTFQASQTIDTNQNGTLETEELNAYAEKLTIDYVNNLSLSVNNQPIELRPTAKNISQPIGAGNLPTLRIEWDLIGDLPKTAETNRVQYENRNYQNRIGWNEIVINRTSGISVFDSTAFGSSVTDELKSYPQESINAPLTERQAEFSFTSGSTVPAGSKLLQNRDGHTTTAVEKDKFAQLIAVPEITPMIALFGLLLAFVFGMMHALSPGHGKAVVGAYLVGTRGTAKHAAFLGLTVTITHTIGVFALGFITLFAANYILPERLLPFLNFVSGLLVLFIGLTLFKERFFSVLGYQKTHQHHHDYHPHCHENDHHHDHEHDHHNDHDHHHHHHGGFVHTHGGSTHSHLPPDEITWRNLLMLGISGGLLPCPSALVLMLSAISTGRIGYGLILTLAFSFGLAATLTTVGLMFLYVGKIFESSSLKENRLVKTLPVFSALVISVIGAVICYNSLL